MRDLLEQIRKETEDHNVDIKVTSIGMYIDVECENDFQLSQLHLIPWIELDNANFEIITVTVRKLKDQLNRRHASIPDHLKSIK